MSAANLDVRNSLIRKEFANGSDRKSLAEKFGLSVSSIRRIVAGVIVAAALVGSVGAAHADLTDTNEKIIYQAWLKTNPGATPDQLKHIESFPNLSGLIAIGKNLNVPNIDKLADMLDEYNKNGTLPPVPKSDQNVGITNTAAASSSPAGTAQGATVTQADVDREQNTALANHAEAINQNAANIVVLDSGVKQNHADILTLNDSVNANGNYIAGIHRDMSTEQTERQNNDQKTGVKLHQLDQGDQANRSINLQQQDQIQTLTDKLHTFSDQVAKLSEQQQQAKTAAERQQTMQQKAIDQKLAHVSQSAAKRAGVEAGKVYQLIQTGVITQATVDPSGKSDAAATIITKPETLTGITSTPVTGGSNPGHTPAPSMGGAAPTSAPAPSSNNGNNTKSFADVNTALDDHEQRIESLEGVTTSSTGSAAAADPQVKVNQQEINTLSGQVSTHTSEIAQIEGHQQTDEQTISDNTTAAKTAQTTADRAEHKADAVKATADQSEADAQTAITTAGQANQTATDAKSIASLADQKADTATTAAGKAATEAHTAKTTADHANQNASTASQKADHAQTDATYAVNTSNAAKQSVTRFDARINDNTSAILSESHARYQGDAQTLAQANQYTDQKFANIDKRIGDVKKRADAGSSSALAAVGIPGLNNGQTWNLGAGVGSFGDAQSVAVGSNYRVSEHVALKAGVTASPSTQDFGGFAGVAIGY